MFFFSTTESIKLQGLYFYFRIFQGSLPLRKMLQLGDNTITPPVKRGIVWSASFCIDLNTEHDLTFTKWIFLVIICPFPLNHLQIPNYYLFLSFYRVPDMGLRRYLWRQTHSFHEIESGMCGMMSCYCYRHQKKDEQTGMPDCWTGLGKACWPSFTYLSTPG